MDDLDLLVPSALVDPGLATELLGGRSLPHLERLLARGERAIDDATAVSGSLTTWQSWVFATRTGTPVERVNVGELWAMACGIAPAARGGRWLAEPAHFALANDHLRLDDPRGLDVTLAEARALADAIEPLLVEAGWRLAPIEPATRTHWMLSRDDAASLSAAAIDRAIGDNVAAWQPRSPDGATPDHGLAWRRCINEIQVLWFDRPVNEAREADGRPAVNTLWLSGNGAPRSAPPGYTSASTGGPRCSATCRSTPARRVRLATFDEFLGPGARNDDCGRLVRRTRAGSSGPVGDLLARQRRAATVSMLHGRPLRSRRRGRVVTLGPRDAAKLSRRGGRAARDVASPTCSRAQGRQAEAASGGRHRAPPALRRGRRHSVLRAALCSTQHHNSAQVRSRPRAAAAAVAAAQRGSTPRGSWPTPSPPASACASSPTTTATAPPPARSRCAACAMGARQSTSSCRTASSTATA